MNIEVKNLENCMQELTITVPAEEAEKEYKRIVNKYKSKVNVPGFRRGKAPLSILERNYGEYFKDEFFHEVSKKYYLKALDENDIHPVSEAEPVKTTWEHNEEFVAVIRYEYMPEFEVTEYENLEVEFEARKVEESDVDSFVEHLRSNMAVSEKVETEIEKGHIVKLELTRQEDEFNFKREIKAGENVYNTELNENLTGKKVGDVFTSTIFDEKDEELPESEAKFRGKAFEIKILDVEKRELPELNNEFAADLGHENIEDMRKKLREELESRVEEENLNQRNNAILAKLVEMNPMEIPKSMVANYAEQLAKDAVSQYNIALEQAKQLYMGVAEYNLKSFNIQQKLKEQIDLEVSEEDKEKLIAEAAENMKMDAEKYKKLYESQIESEEFMQSVKDRKLMDYLADSATFVKPKPIEEIEEQEA